jgi:CHAD domain-containing protein
MKSEVKDVPKLGLRLQEEAIEHITAAIAELEVCDDASLLEVVHGVRKRLKKLRALWRIVRRSMGEREWRVGDAAFARVGRKLGSLRDAQVVVLALTKLRERYFERRTPALLKQALRHFSADARRRAQRVTRAGTLNEIMSTLQAMRTQCCGWNMHDFGRAKARAAVRSRYRCARDAAKLSRRTTTVRRLHQWRKQTKMLADQLRLLRTLCPGYLDEFGDELAVLAELLGDDHDLVILRARLVSRRGELKPAREFIPLIEILDLRREELIRAALDLGKRLFDEPAKVFARRLKKRASEHQVARHQAPHLGERATSNERP